jgi:uncharacterized protein
MHSETRFILGTAQFGLAYGINNNKGKISESDAHNILKAAYDEGIAEIDTAEAYGDAETVVGKFIRSGIGVFDINSKFRVGSSQNVSEQLTLSLKTLGVESLNTYFFHSFSDISHPFIFDSLNNLKSERKIRFIGASIYSNAEFEVCINNKDIDVIQIPFNLLDNFTKRGQLIRLAKEKGKIVQVRSVFLQGLFFKEESTFLPALTPLRKYVRSLKDIADNAGYTMTELALAYVFSTPDIDGVVIGIDSMDHLHANMKALKKSIPDTVVNNINSIHVIEEDLLFPYNWR